MKRLIGAPLFGAVVLTSAALVVAGCATVESTSAVDSIATTSSGGVDGPTPEAAEPAGPQSGETQPGDIQSAAETARNELLVLAELDATNVLPQAEMTVDFTDESNDFRSADGSIFEVVATSDDGSYLIGRVGEKAVARIGLMCAEDRPGDLMVSDTKGRTEQEWVPLIDQLVPSLVEVSGCQAALLGSPTDCLGLPDDPAACIAGDGEGR